MRLDFIFEFVEYPKGECLGSVVKQDHELFYHAYEFGKPNPWDDIRPATELGIFPKFKLAEAAVRNPDLYRK
jgi:hypothetical protein